MNVSRRIAFAVATGWFSRFANIVLNLLFTRMLFKRMGLEEQGLWLLLGTSTAFLSLLDLGFSPTLTRRIALAYGKPNETEKFEEIANLLATGERVFRIISLTVFVISWTIGAIFIKSLTFKEMSPQIVWLAWTVLCASNAIFVWGSVWNCLLSGMGWVGWNTLINVGFQILTISFQIILVRLGFGIVYMAIVTTATQLLGRQINLKVASKVYPEMFRLRGTWKVPLIRSMASPSLRTWITGLGTFLVLKTDQYFITYFLGSDKLPSYQAAYQLIFNVHVFSYSFALASAVYISHLWQAGDHDRVRTLVKRSIRIGMILMVCGTACFSVCGKQFIDLWLGTGHFVGYPIVWVFCAMLILETHHGIIAACSRATEFEAFAFITILSGVLNLIVTCILVKPFGLLGVALGTFATQAVTTNWYVAYRGLRRLKMSVREHFTGVIFPVLITFIASLGLGYAIVQMTAAANSNLITLVASGTGVSLLMLVALWIYGLDSHHRQRILKKIRIHSISESG